MYTIREASLVLKYTVNVLQKRLKRDLLKPAEERMFPNARIAGTGGGKLWQIPQEDIDAYLKKQIKD